MQKLADYADATAALGGRDRLNMVYLDVYRGAHTAAFSLDAGARLDAAVRKVYAEGRILTPDQGGTAKTAEFTRAVIANL